LLDGLANLTELRIYHNQFTFEDIEPNMDVPSTLFLYSPQDSVGIEQSVQLDIGDVYNLLVECGGNNNQYQWYKNASPLQAPDPRNIN